MSNKSGSSWSDHPLVVIVGVIASIVAIVIFVTGRSNLQELLAEFYSTSGSPTPDALMETAEITTPIKDFNSTNACRMPDGQTISPDFLEDTIGGKASNWSENSSNSCIWQYKGTTAVFRHPGGNLVIAVRTGSSKLTNSQDCILIVSFDFDVRSTRVKCPQSGAVIEADEIIFDAQNTSSTTLNPAKM
jgi:hypothetical protein